MTNEQRFDAVFYDLDGTLIDSVPIITLCFRKAYEDVLGRCTRTDADLMSYIGKPLSDTFPMHDRQTAERLVESYLKINQYYLDNDLLPEFPNIKEDILYIKSLGIKQGIVTSKRRDSASPTISFKHYDEIFDCFVFKEDTKRHKPLADPLLKAAADLELTDMSRILYVGDALPDLLCAQNAGCPFALVKWTRMPENDFPDKGNMTLLERLKDIPCII